CFSADPDIAGPASAVERGPCDRLVVSDLRRGPLATHRRDARLKVARPPLRWCNRGPFSLKCCGPCALAASGGSQASSGFGQNRLGEASPDKRGIRPSSDDQREIEWWLGSLQRHASNRRTRSHRYALQDSHSSIWLPPSRRWARKVQDGCFSKPRRLSH